MKLIDKSALVAEIENLLDKGKYHEEYDCAYRDGNNGALYALKNKLNTLEVKEVDLEKEIVLQWSKFCLNGKDRESFVRVAKHLFELGLQARTDKELVDEVYSHIDSIKDTADRMTSGNFMHHKAAIKFSANTIAKVLELIGFKAQKGE